MAGLTADAAMHQRRLFLDGRLAGGMRMAGDTRCRGGSRDAEHRLHTAGPRIVGREGEVGAAVGVVPPDCGRGGVDPCTLLTAMTTHTEIGALGDKGSSWLGRLLRRRLHGQFHRQRCG